MAVTLKVCWYVGKAKMGLRGGSCFRFLKICLNFSAVCLQFFKKIDTSQTHFGFTNIGSEMHTFRVTDETFDLGHPVEVT